MGHIQFPQFFQSVVKIQGNWLIKKASNELPYPTQEELELKKKLAAISSPYLDSCDDDQIQLIFNISTSDKLIGKKREKFLTAKSFTEEELNLTCQYFSSSDSEKIQISSNEVENLSIYKYSVRIFGRDSDFYNQGKSSEFYKACNLLSKYYEIPSQDVELIINYFKKIIAVFLESRQQRPRGFADEITEKLDSLASLNQPYIIWYLDRELR